jgi:hypothetical protein
LERLANHSCALRCGGMVLQSGTIAIDTDGSIIGENDIGAQVGAIVEIEFNGADEGKDNARRISSAMWWRLAINTARRVSVLR